MIRFVFVLLLLLAGSLKSLAQPDSVLTLEAFRTMVLKHHPVAYQARLIGASGQFALLMSRGGFDPKLNGSIAQKYLDGKQYYSYLGGKLKVPVWFGIELEAGYQLNDGSELNPESYTDKAGLWNAGISIDLGSGLLMDQRRADLMQGKIIRESTQLEQTLALNQLLYDAETAYWEWSKAALKRDIVQESVTTAEERLEAIRQSAVLGDKPFVDTLKALIQVQTREVRLQEMELQWNNKSATLNTFLWKDGFIPLELSEGTQPEELPTSYEEGLPTSNLQWDTLVQNHPEYLISTYKIDQAKINYRLQREAIKPELKLNYNALANHPSDQPFQYNIANYNWGAHLSYPIFIRKERGKTRLAEVKLREQEYGLIDKQLQVKMNIQQALNQWSFGLQQAQTQERATANYLQLLDSEETLFNNGESSLFLVNQRDLSLLDARLKWADLRFQNMLGALNYKLATQQW